MKGKYILVFLIFITLSFNSKAQGNLQFSQVIQQSFNQAIPTNSMATLSTITVPAGKVLKIETASMAGNILDIIPGSRLYIGNHCLWQLNYLSAGGLIVDRNLPLWLNAGTYSLQVYHQYGSSTNLRTSFSGIEFNVIP